MKVKTSITLSEDILEAVDKALEGKLSRSQVIEQALREFLARRERRARDARELEILNREADALNDEVADVLEHQAKV